MNQQDTMHALLPYLPLVILILVVLRLARRTQRARVLNPGRLWIGPAIVVAFAVYYISVATHLGPPLSPVDWSIIAASAVVGAIVGALRAHFLHLTRRPDGQIESRLSMWGLVFILVWFGGRQLLRQSGWVNAGAPLGVYADSGLSLAFALVVTNAVVLSRRCQALQAQSKPTAANLPGGAL
jgi:hypothetical protein